MQQMNIEQQFKRYRITILLAERPLDRMVDFLILGQIQLEKGDMYDVVS
jgi:hypothetical protein